MTDLRKNNGGARKGAGRIPIPDNDKKVTLSFYIRKKHLETAKAKIQPIVDKINAR